MSLTRVRLHRIHRSLYITSTNISQHLKIIDNTHILDMMMMMMCLPNRRSRERKSEEKTIDVANGVESIYTASKRRRKKSIDEII